MHWHKWSKWEQFGQESIIESILFHYRSEPFIAQFQKRHCETCNKVEIKLIN